VQSEFVSDLCGVHRVGEILFVGKHEEERVTKFVFVEHALKFFASFRDTFTIVRIDYEDDTLSVLEVCCFPPTSKG
jgi:hypothetical protein